MTDAGAKAFANLLQTDVAGLTGLLEGLSAITTLSAPLAAVFAIIGIVAGGLAAWISAEDATQNGVVVYGGGWIAVWVEAAS